MKKHIWLVIQIAASLLYIIQFLRDPESAGIFPPYILYFLLCIIISLITTIVYLTRHSANIALVSISITILSVFIIPKLAVTIKSKIRLENSLIIAESNAYTLILFKDGTYEFKWFHVEDGKYYRGQYIKKDTIIEIVQKRPTAFDLTEPHYDLPMDIPNVFYINDSIIYFLPKSQKYKDEITYETEVFRIIPPADYWKFQ